MGGRPRGQRDERVTGAEERQGAKAEEEAGRAAGGRQPVRLGPCKPSWSEATWQRERSERGQATRIEEEQSVAGSRTRAARSRRKRRGDRTEPRPPSLALMRLDHWGSDTGEQRGSAGRKEEGRQRHAGQHSNPRKSPRHPSGQQRTQSR